MRECAVTKSAIAFLVAASLVFGACSAGSDGSPSDDPTDKGSVGSHGPLSASVQPGLKAVYAPKRVPYFVTFGSFRLCRKSDAEGTPVLERVAYTTSVEPSSISPIIRRIPPAEDRAGQAINWAPLLGVLGKPRNYYFGKAKGRLEQVSGSRVEDLCSEIKDHDHEYTELLNVMKVSAAGGQVENFSIYYHVGRDEFVLQVPWTLIGCGAQIDPSICQR